MFRSTSEAAQDAHDHTTAHKQGVDTSLVLKFIATSFLYLMAGLIFLAADIASLINMERDAIFILWLFGFVVMIIFGLSYMFASGLSRNSAMMNATENKEFILLNAGVIMFFAGFSGMIPAYAGRPVALCGLVLLMVSVALHIVNIVIAASSAGNGTSGKRAFRDDY